MTYFVDGPNDALEIDMFLMIVLDGCTQTHNLKTQQRTRALLSSLTFQNININNEYRLTNRQTGQSTTSDKSKRETSLWLHSWQTFKTFMLHQT